MVILFRVFVGILYVGYSKLLSPRRQQAYHQFVVNSNQAGLSLFEGLKRTRTRCRSSQLRILTSLDFCLPLSIHLTSVASSSRGDPLTLDNAPIWVS